ncbi:MAG: hypothetical protein PHQ36_07920 [Anaerolineales bacterium]|nr:hypothetical protein [Anaerolineales bacterium]
MRNFRKTALLLPLLIAVLINYAFQLEKPIMRQGAASPTPTYDPFVETPLPPNPTEFELGKNLYWHWCMPCHGDQGQGLTDAFRAMWEADHQNCWARGCHVGRRDDEGFPIPTVVPALVNEKRLQKFSSLQSLADFLEATHPPQSPGILKREEYRAIALFVFTLNDRLPPNPAPAESPTPVLSAKPNRASNLPRLTFFSIALAFAFFLLILRRKNLKR